MKKYEFEERVLESDLNQSAKLVLLAYLHHCKQAELKEVWPSYGTIGKFAGVSAETAGKTARQLAEAGWLVTGSMHKPRLQGYDFPEQVPESTGNLAKKKRNLNPESIGNLKQGTKRVVPDTTGSSSRYVTAKFPIEVGLVPDTVSGRKDIEKNTLEKKEQNGAATAPGLPEDVPILSLESPSSCDPSLEGSTGADARPLEVEDEEIETDEHALEASVSNPGHQETQEESEAGRKNPDPVPDASEIQEWVAERGRKAKWDQDTHDRILKLALDLRASGETCDVVDLVKQAVDRDFIDTYVPAPKKEVEEEAWF